MAGPTSGTPPAFSSATHPRYFDFEFAWDSQLAGPGPIFSDRVLEVRVVQDEDCLLSEKTAETGLNSPVRSEASVDDLPQRASEEPTESSPSQTEPVKRLHINTLLLASKSDVFRVMFTNGMLESDSKNPIVMRVTPQEKAPLLQLIQFLYLGALPFNASPECVLSLLLCADKYNVASCAAACAANLAKAGMTMERCTAYLSLPVGVRQIPEVVGLLDAAKLWLVEQFFELEDTWQDSNSEFMKLPLVAVEALLSSSALSMVSEETLFSATLEWCRSHYEASDVEGVFLKLLPLLRFPQMSVEFLRDTVSKCKEMKSLAAVQLISEAGLFKLSASDYQKSLASATTKHNRFEVRKTARRIIFEVLVFERLQELGSMTSEDNFKYCGARFSIYLKSGPPDATGQKHEGAYVLCERLGEEKIPVYLTIQVQKEPGGPWIGLLSRCKVVYSKGSAAWGSTFKPETFAGHTGSLTFRATICPASDQS